MFCKFSEILVNTRVTYVRFTSNTKIIPHLFVRHLNERPNSLTRGAFVHAEVANVESSDKFPFSAKLYVRLDSERICKVKMFYTGIHIPDGKIQNVLLVANAVMAEFRRMYDEGIYVSDSYIKIAKIDAHMQRKNYKLGYKFSKKILASYLMAYKHIAGFNVVYDVMNNKEVRVSWGDNLFKIHSKSTIVQNGKNSEDMKEAYYLLVPILFEILEEMLMNGEAVREPGDSIRMF